MRKCSPRSRERVQRLPAFSLSGPLRSPRQKAGLKCHESNPKTGKMLTPITRAHAAPLCFPGPRGTLDNSPAIYRRVHASPSGPRPSGTLERISATPTICALDRSRNFHFSRLIHGDLERESQSFRTDRESSLLLTRVRRKTCPVLRQFTLSLLDAELGLQNFILGHERGDQRLAALLPLRAGSLQITDKIGVFPFS